MKMSRCPLIQIFLLLFLFLLFPSFIQAEIANCTAITSVPYTIAASGIYCLTRNLETAMTEGNAITINVNNVVIEMNGHKLGGGAAGAGTLAFGIHANQRKNITIRNGTIRGFYVGVVLDGSPYTTSQGHVIEDIRADMNTFVGISVVGRGNIIRNNQVLDTGGSTLTNYVYGIRVWGPRNWVLNNDVYETEEGEGVNGISIVYSDDTVVMNNRIGSQIFGTRNYGIYIYGSENVIVKSNTISRMEKGIYFLSSTGLYGDNLASGCTTPFSGGTSAGSTNYSN
jgi:parallel beta-helix repeat protein